MAYVVYGYLPGGLHLFECSFGPLAEADLEAILATYGFQAFESALSDLGD
jgi:hypothetical protein